MKTLYMIGHSNHPWAKFVELIERHQIRTIIDVRSRPVSRFFQFNERAMRANLPPGISYENIKELGGKNPIAVARQRLYLATALRSSGPENPVCIMCSEGEFRDCHRHYILAPLAIELGYEVQQILRNGSLELDEGPTSLTLQKMKEFIPQ